MTFHLVYQVGIANVFDESFTRVMQHAYSPCEWYCKGAAQAGATIRVFHCDVAGDCTHGHWKAGPGELWIEAKNPPKSALAHA